MPAKLIRRLLLLAASCMGIHHVALADAIRMKNGDLITGEIIKKEAATVLLRTSYAGELSIQWSEIETLSSEKPVRIVLSDGVRAYGELLEALPGRARIQIGERAYRDFDLAQTRYLNPPAELSGEGIRWTGQIHGGGSITQGNTELKSLHVDAETVARGPRDRYTLGGVTNRTVDTGRETQSNSRAYGKYDHFMSPQWYGYVNLSLENDKFRDLRLRTLGGPGIGYQIFETPNLNLSLESGLNYIHEDYYAAADKGYPGARWAIKYDQRVLNGYAQVFHEHEALIGFDKGKQILLTSKTGIRFPIVLNMNASAQLNYNWDGDPAPGRRKEDTALIFTVGYGW